MKRTRRGWPAPPTLRRVVPLAGVLAALAALPACFSGLNSRAPPEQRYLLQALIPHADALVAPSPAPAAAGGIEVLRPNAAPGLAGDGIAVLRPGARLDFYANARWAADVPAALQTLVIDSLRNAGRFASVESDSGPFVAQYLLSLDLQHFEARYGSAGPPTVEVELVASLGRRSDRSVIASFSARASAPADADRMQAVIAAFGQATGAALAQLASAIAP